MVTAIVNLAVQGQHGKNQPFLFGEAFFIYLPALSLDAPFERKDQRRNVVRILAGEEFRGRLSLVLDLWKPFQRVVSF